MRWRHPRVLLHAAILAWSPITVVVLAVLAVIVYSVISAVQVRTITISSGPEGSAFQRIASAYAKVLEHDRVHLEVVTSEGSQQNLERVSDLNSRVKVALVQDGTEIPGNTSDVVSLGSVAYEPLTIFYYGAQPVTRLFQLKGGRIGIGKPGSGTRNLALALLGANDITAQNSTLEPIEGTEAMKALMNHQVDAIFLSGDSATPTNFRTLMHAPDIHLFSFTDPEPYLRRFRYLTKLVVPAGTFDIGADLPRHDVTLLAPTVQLLAWSSLNAQLIDPLIEAAQRVNGKGGLLEEPGAFPKPLRHGWPLSATAVQYYKSGKTFLYRHFPFWLAVLISDIWVVLVPLIAVGIPAVEFAPTIYRWRVRSKLYEHYANLMSLERAALEPDGSLQPDDLDKRLDAIESAVIAMRIPASFAGEVYTLRQYILFARSRLKQA